MSWPQGTKVKITGRNEFLRTHRLELGEVYEIVPTPMHLMDQLNTIGCVRSRQGTEILLRSDEARRV